MLRRATKSAALTTVLVSFTFHSTGAAVMFPPPSAMKAAPFAAPAMKGLPKGVLPPTAPKSLRHSKKAAGPSRLSSYMGDARTVGAFAGRTSADILRVNAADAKNVIGIFSEIARDVVRFNGEQAAHIPGAFSRDLRIIGGFVYDRALRVTLMTAYTLGSALGKIPIPAHLFQEAVLEIEHRVEMLGRDAWRAGRTALTPDHRNAFIEMQMAALTIGGGSETRQAPRPEIFEPRPLPSREAAFPGVEEAASRLGPEDLIIPEPRGAFDRVVSRIAEALEDPAAWAAEPARSVERPEVRRPVNDRSRLIVYPSLRRSSNFVPFRNFQRMARGLTFRRLTGGAVPKFEGRWIKGDGISYRVNYLKPIAISYADGNGVHYRIPGRHADNPGEVIPEDFWGAYPIYRHNQMVDFEIEILNTGKSEIKDMEIFARQEAFNPRGQGRILPAGQSNFKVKSLQPGAKTRVRGKFKVTGSWIWDGSFEQTHVKITGLPGGKIRETLGHDVHAGIIDPPPDDL